MIKSCIICEKEFEAASWATKSCSKECRLKHNNNRKKKTILNHLDTFNCKECGKEVTRYRIRSGFCSRSCASKKYIADGTFDKWRLRINPKEGINKNCIICNISFYAQPHEILSKNLCGNPICKTNYMSNWMLENNPMKGKKEKSGVREKVKNTLLQKYGVQNAYELAKHTVLSKPQKQIIDFLRESTNYNILVDFPIYNNFSCYKVDILIKELNLIIEFNGTYWHTDPRFYKEDYLNKKKNKLAKEIWLEDAKRIEFLKSLNYDVKVIWEFDYNQNKDKILKEILNVEKN